MNEPPSVRIAAALLRRFDVDPALIGDLLEAHAAGASRLWLWRQVAGAVFVSASGRGCDTRPHRRTTINLAVTPRGSSVGGVGAVAIALVITLVLPQAWWLLVIGIAGGVCLGSAMVVINRHRELRRPVGERQGILLPIVLLLCASVAPGAQSSGQPAPAVPMDPVGAIADAFRTHNVVMLPGGHGSKLFHDLLLTLARDPRLQGVVNDIVVEFGSSRYQDLIDRYMRGDDIPFAPLKQVWQNTSIPGVANDGPYVEEFYREMRAINASLPPERRIRVLLGDPPIDWNHVTNRGDVRKWTVVRSTYPADLIRREVIARGRRALVVYGHLHFPRNEMLTNYDMSNWQAQTMTSWLESNSPAKVFVVWAEGGDEVLKLQPDLASWPRLSIARVRGTVLGAADFTVFNGDRERFRIRGVDDFVKIPKEEHRPIRMEEQVDAIIWNRNAPPIPVLLSAATCADPAYLPMRLARIALAGIPPGEGDAARRACAVHGR